MCRQWVSNWARTAAKEKKLINQERWTFIQKHFKAEVERRRCGADASLSGDRISFLILSRFEQVCLCI